MTYFQNIHSLAELKKQYRALAIANHPDKGGSTQTMQQINAEFTRLHALWKDDTSVADSASGYENDYAGATAEELPIMSTTNTAGRAATTRDSEPRR